MFRLPGDSNGCDTKVTGDGGGAETPTIEFAAAAQHPFPFHGLDLCISHRTRESLPPQFLLNFLRIWLDCQDKLPQFGPSVQSPQLDEGTAHKHKI
jgi:hypothetical protein